MYRIKYYAPNDFPVLCRANGPHQLHMWWCEGCVKFEVSPVPHFETAFTRMEPIEDERIPEGLVQAIEAYLVAEPDTYECLQAYGALTDRAAELLSVIAPDKIASLPRKTPLFSGPSPKP